MFGAGVVIALLTVGALVLAAFAPSTPLQAMGQELSVEAVGLLVTEGLLRAVSAQNAMAREVARARSSSNRPRSDFLGIPLAADFDLRVPLILDSGFAARSAESVDPMADFD